VKRIIKRVLVALVCLLVALLITAIAVFFNELRSLSSIKQIDDYGMFQMTYHGDYGFDGFLKVGASSDGEIEAYVTKHLLKGLPIDLGITGGGCTAFVVRDENGDVLFGRNFDFPYSPSMQLVTHPATGYASVSTVNLSFAGYGQGNLPSGLNFSSFLALAGPYLPFDGMNEKGLAMALLAVPKSSPPYDASKVTLNTTASIRLVLDKAATVDEAVALLRQYNIYFSADVDSHFLIADATGRSVLVEYYNGALQTVTTPDPYQIASNFIAYNGVNIGEGYSEFERYDAVKAAIDSNGGHLNQAQAVSLLAQVGGRLNGEDRLQWSVVYNLTKLSGVIFAHRHTDNLISFELPA